MTNNVQSVHEKLTKQFNWVLEVVTDAEKSHRLTPWEAGFVRNMKSRLDQYGILADISERQVEIIQQIEEKIYVT